MKTLHNGTSQVSRTVTVEYEWKFEEADDHEHPYILTVTIDGETHSEGYEHDIGQTDAAAKAETLARDVAASG